MLVRRRFFLQAATTALAAAFLPRCVARSSDAAKAPSDSGVEEDDIEFQTPRLITTTLTGSAAAGFVRTFSGGAYPQNLRFKRTTGERVNLYDLFPNAHDPFAISTNHETGTGGFALSVPDRAQAGVLPDPNGEPWALCMIPFGVALDGSILDPSGPWYDGGPADPQNPFDRKCSGWEYDPISSVGSNLVGVPLEVRGHTQPSGLFHYHGYPRLFIANLKHSLLGKPEAEQPLLVGWSADGYPIYAPEIPAAATKSGKTLHLFSGYVLRTGERTAVPHTNPALIPPGDHDGTYAADWVYDPDAKRAQIEAALTKNGSYLALTKEARDAGDADYVLLDATNGLVTTDFTVAEYEGTIYAYVMTEDWPEIPRMLRFEPSDSFRNVIPYQGPRGEGRKQLYDACADGLDVHDWFGREPY